MTVASSGPQGRQPLIRWQWCRSEALTLTQLYTLMAAREAVFVVEQQCAYQELDGLDLAAHHLVAWADDAVAACLRVLAPGVRYPEPAIGRVLTGRDFRRQGLGRELMIRALAQLGQLYPGQAVRISAQTYLEDFYRSLGFESVSAVYDEDGIPHVEMLRPA